MSSPLSKSMPAPSGPGGVFDLSLLPRLKICQAGGANEDAPVAALYLAGVPGFASYVRDVVLLAVRKERSLLLPYEEDEADEVREHVAETTGVAVLPSHEGPVCYSHDRILPVARENIPTLSGDCLSCPLARWRRLDDGRRIQDCAESFRLVLFDAASQRPCVLFARSGGVRPVRDLLAALQAAGRRAHRPTFAFRFNLTTEEVEGRRGPYYVAAFGQPTPIDDVTQVALLAEFRRACTASLLDGEAA